MPFKDELEFESSLINLLITSCGWEDVIKNPTEEDLIKNWANILFENNKEKDLLNNCPLTKGEMDQILNKVNSLKTPVELNTFINGKTVTIVRDNPDDPMHLGRSVSLKIYDRMEIAGGKSRYQIAEQPQFTTNNSIYPTRRGDLMLLINGMPVFHIELKRSNVSITHAEVQIEKYVRNNCFTGIFSMVQIFVAMNPEEAVYFANPGINGKFKPEFYFHWEDFNNDIVNDWKRFAHSVLSIPMAHEMVGFYTIADTSDNILKVMRSYQCIAANAISDKVAKSSWTKSDQHGGFIWHTTGSGKSMTSFKAAQLIANAGIADKVVFLLDRVELGEQSLDNFRGFANPDESVHSTENTEELISKLKSSDADDTLIVTSIQKMSRIKKEGQVGIFDLEEIQSKNIVFIIDECHRDQKGDMHQDIKRTFPNAMYFGFTGTPDIYTADIFGDELHRYSIAHGIRDKNVLGFDPNMVLTFNDNDIRESVALKKCNVKTVAEAMENSKTQNIYLKYMNKTSEVVTMLDIEKEIPKIQYSPTDDNPTEHMKVVVKDIIDNWTVRSVNNKFHALFATDSIKEAIMYYRLFKESGTNLRFTTIFSPEDDNNSESIAKMDGITEILTDYNQRYNSLYNIGTYPEFKKDVCSRLAHKEPYIYLNEEDKIDLVIVVNQLLTGFDSKWINTLYMDKVLKGKDLVQAISRTNRLFGPEKPFGTFFWYRYPHTMKKNLDEAIENYSGSSEFSVYVNKLDKNIEGMNFCFKEIKDMFDEKGINNFEKVDKDLIWQKEFAKRFVALTKYWESAKIQGFIWSVSKYTIKKQDDNVIMIECLIDEITYATLLKRYKELFRSKGDPNDDDVAFDIDVHITGIQTDRIDNDYINSKFDVYKKTLAKNDPEAKSKALKELHNTFAMLTSQEQKYAKIFLHDLENGNIVLDEDKTFKEYITEYQVKAHNDSVLKLAEAFGISKEKLRNMMDLHLTKANINQFGRLDELIDDLDVEKAQEFFKQKGEELVRRKAKMKAISLIEEFILSNGFDGESFNNL